MRGSPDEAIGDPSRAIFDISQQVSLGLAESSGLATAVNRKSFCVVRKSSAHADQVHAQRVHEEGAVERRRACEQAAARGTAGAFLGPSG
jgi:hypothetical protein